MGPSGRPHNETQSAIKSTLDRTNYSNRESSTAMINSGGQWHYNEKKNMLSLNNLPQAHPEICFDRESSSGSDQSNDSFDSEDEESPL